MDRSDIERLARTRAEPAVSVLLAPDRRRPGNAEDPLRLRHLVAEATTRVRRDHDPATADAVIGRLEAAAASVDLAHPPAGLAILVTEDESHVLRLPFRVREHVEVNRTFATRDLLLGAQRSPRFRVLVLSERRSRLFEAVDGVLEERTRGGFPVAVEVPREEDTPHRDLPIHEGQRDEALRVVARAVDSALRAVSREDPLPVVLVGVGRVLAAFEAATGSHPFAIAGRVAGNHSAAPPEALADLVDPVAREWFARRDEEAVARLVEAGGASRSAFGVDAVWQPAHEGRGQLLVAEEDLVWPARIVAGRPEPAADDGHGVVDAVDEVAEAVLVQGGDVVFVPSGALADRERIGLLLRY